MDVDSGMRLPPLHCAFVGCDWTDDPPMTTHWVAELRLYAHLVEKRSSQEMAEIFAHCCGPDDAADFSALAYYMAAVCEQERQHMPLIGPSVDRRTLALVCRLANSNTLRCLTCFACGHFSPGEILDPFVSHRLRRGEWRGPAATVARQRPPSRNPDVPRQRHAVEVRRNRQPRLP